MCSFLYSDLRIEFVSIRLPYVRCSVRAHYLRKFFIWLFHFFNHIRLQEINFVDLHHFRIFLGYLINIHQRDLKWGLKLNTFWKIISLTLVINSMVEVAVEIAGDLKLIFPILKVNIELIPILFNLLHSMIYLFIQFNIIQILFASITTFFKNSYYLLTWMLSILPSHGKVNGCHLF